MLPAAAAQQAHSGLLVLHVQHKLHPFGLGSVPLCCETMLKFLTCSTRPCRSCWRRLSITVNPLAGLNTWAPSQASYSTTRACKAGLLVTL